MSELTSGQYLDSKAAMCRGIRFEKKLEEAMARIVFISLAEKIFHDVSMGNHKNDVIPEAFRSTIDLRAFISLMESQGYENFSKASKKDVKLLLDNAIIRVPLGKSRRKQVAHLTSTIG